MPNVSKIIRIRQQQRAREQRSPWLRLGLVSGLVVSLLMVTISMVGVGWYIDMTRAPAFGDALASFIRTSQWLNVPAHPPV